MVLWIHLVASAVWLGGIITMGAVVVALRRQEVERSVLQAVARQFGRVSWTAMGVAVLSGAWMAFDFLGRPLLAAKVGVVALTAGLAAYHQFTARNQSARSRGMMEGLILLCSLAIFAVGVNL